MTKKIIWVLILGLVFSGVLVSPALAVNAPNASGTVNTIKEKVEKVKAQVQETRKEKVTRLANNLLTHFANVLSRVESLLARTTERIAKMKAAGKDVAAAEAKVPAANTAITAAKTSIENLRSQLPNIVTASTTPKAVRDTVKTAVNKTVQDVKKAHQAVVEVIRALKPRPLNATSTATTTDN